MCCHTASASESPSSATRRWRAAASCAAPWLMSPSGSARRRARSRSTFSPAGLRSSPFPRPRAPSTSGKTRAHSASRSHPRISRPSTPTPGGSDTMRLGISLTSQHHTDDPREAARWMIERAAAAQRAGLDSLFVGDHHATPHPYYQNTPMLGRLLAEWGDNPAGCLFLLPLWNPVLAAEQVGTLASIAGGRFIFQCAIGGDERQSSAMGTEFRFRPSAFEEAFDAVQRLLRGETVSGTRRYSFKDARIGLLPPEPVEYWIGGRAEPAIDRAARMGDGWIADPGLTLEEAKSQLAYYLERCRLHGRKPSAIAIRRDIYVGESDQEADETARAVIERGYRGFSPQALSIGGVDKVIGSFRAYAEAGYTDIIVRHITLDQSKVLASMSRLAG